MSKFCGQCGTELTDDAEFCVGCGAQLGGAQPSVQQAQPDAANGLGANVENIVNGTVGKKKLDKKKLIIAGSIGAAVLIVLIILLKLIFGSSYKTPLNKMEKIYEKADGKSLQTISMSSKQIKAIKNSDIFESIYDGDLDEYFDDSAKDIQKSLKKQYGDDVTFNYKVKDKTKIEKNDLKDYQKQLEDWAKDYDVDYNPKVSKGYELKVRIEIEGEDDFNGYVETIKVYKVDGDWVTSSNF